MRQALGNAWSAVSQWAGGLAWWQWGMLLLGIALFLAGLWWLARGREKNNSAVGVSVPTALAAGFAQIFLGFHLIAWTLPAGTSGAFVGMQWWWAVILACCGLVGLSLLIDRLGWDVEPPDQKK